MTHPTVDAHQHFWQRKSAAFDYSWLESRGHEAINRDFLPQDLLPSMADVLLEGVPGRGARGASDQDDDITLVVLKAK